VVAEIFYRALTQAESNQLVGVIREAFSEEWLCRTIYGSPGVTDYLANLLAFPQWQNEHVFWGAFIDQQLVGVVHGRVVSNSWHLNNIAVKPSYQNRGIGKELVNIWFSLGYKRGYRVFTLDVDESKDRVVNWYRSLGFNIKDATYIYEKSLSTTDSLSKFADQREIQLLNWEDAQAWQFAYGFSSFVLVDQGNRWRVGRIGNRYFRVSVDDDVSNMVETAIYRLAEILSVIDPARKLLIQSKRPISNREFKHLETTLRMWRKEEG
jgi:ribosomal protein S18 acetylase RimI-like enzyme